MALTHERLAELKKQLEPEEHYRVAPARCACGFDAYKLNGIMIDYAEEFRAHMSWAGRQKTYKVLTREESLELIAEIERLNVLLAGTPDNPVVGVTPSGRRVTRSERKAAARARVSADKLRGVETADWIKELADD